MTLVAARRRPTLVVVVAAAGVFASVFSIPVLLLASPSVAHDFTVSVRDLQWRNLLFWSMFGVWLPVCGRAVDRLGARRMYVAGLLVFVVAAATQAAATHWSVFLAGAALQGLADALAVAAQPLLYARAGGDDRPGWAFGLQGAVLATAQLGGPAVGGLLLEQVSWRAVLWALAALAIVLLALAFRVLPADSDLATRPDVAWRGAVALTVVAVALQGAVLTEGTGRGVLLLVAVGGGLAFALTGRGYLPAGVRARPAFVQAMAGGVLAYFAVNALAMFLPILLVVTDGVSTGAAGAILVTDAVVLLALAARAGQLADRRPVWCLRIGFGALAGAALALAAGSGAPAVVVVALAVLGAGGALVFPAQGAAAMNAAPADRLGSFLALFNSAQFVAIGLATVVFAPLVQGGSAVSLSRGGFAVVGVLAAVLFLGGAALTARRLVPALTSEASCVA